MVGFREKLVAAVQRVDEWANVVTGIGNVLGRGWRGSYSYQQSEKLSDGMVELMINGDPFAAIICSAVPKHALRRGVTVKLGATADESALKKYLADLRLVQRTREAWTWARAFGGGALVLGCDDGRRPEEPLDEQGLRAVRFLVAVTSRELRPQTWCTDPMSPRFGEPELYMLTRNGGGGGSEVVLVHHTRVVRFEGAPTTRQRRIELQGWGESYLNRVSSLLAEWSGAHVAVVDLLQQSSIGVMKIRDLSTIVGSDATEAFKNRMDAMDIARSVAKAILLDAEGESYERVEVGALTGIPDVVDRFTLRLAGALEMPVSILLGREPAGLNATGDSDIRAWYDALQATRDEVARPALETIVRLVLVSSEGPTRGVVPPGWSLEFPPLWQMTEGETADLRAKVATTDDVYLRNGVVTPEEVARSRFRPEGWSMETTVTLAPEPPPAAPPTPRDPDPADPSGDPSLPADGDASRRAPDDGSTDPHAPAGILPPRPMNSEGTR